MSTAFATKNGLTFTRYLLIEFVSKYPSTFLIILFSIIKTLSFILFVDISFTASFNEVFLSFFEVLFCCCCCYCCCCSFEILFALCFDLSLLLVFLCLVRILVKSFVCLAPGLALISWKPMLLSFSDLILQPAKLLRFSTNGFNVIFVWWSLTVSFELRENKAISWGRGFRRVEEHFQYVTFLFHLFA